MAKRSKDHCTASRPQTHCSFKALLQRLKTKQTELAEPRCTRPVGDSVSQKSKKR